MTYDATRTDRGFDFGQKLPTYRRRAVIPAPVGHGNEISRKAAKRAKGGVSGGQGLENPREDSGEVGTLAVKYLPLLGT